jgi:hypothetical protein
VVHPPTLGAGLRQTCSALDGRKADYTLQVRRGTCAVADPWSGQYGADDKLTATQRCGIDDFAGAKRGSRGPSLPASASPVRETQSDVEKLLQKLQAPQ